MNSGKEIPSSPVLEDEYDLSSLEVAEGLVRYYDWVLDRISGSVGGRTLEVGAGIGTLSARVEPLTSELVLVEPAEMLPLDARVADALRALVSMGKTPLREPLTTAR